MPKLTDKQYFLKLAEHYNDLGMELEMLHTVVCDTAACIQASKDVSTDKPQGNSWDYFKMSKLIESLHRAAPYLLDQKERDQMLVLANKCQDTSDEISKLCG